MKEYFSKNSYKISYFPVFPTLAKFGVFPRTVITGNYRWEFPPPVFPGQPWIQWVNLAENDVLFCLTLLHSERPKWIQWVNLAHNDVLFCLILLHSERPKWIQWVNLAENDVFFCLTLLHSKRPNLYTILAFLNTIGLIAQHEISVMSQLIWIYSVCPLVFTRCDIARMKHF